MSPLRTASTVPKRQIVATILETIAHDSVRQHLRIGPGTDLRDRLEDFPKVELLALLTSTPEGEEALDAVERRYPLHSPPTLYLVHVRRRPQTAALLQLTARLSGNGRDGGMLFGEHRTVRVVYMGQPAYRLQFNAAVVEIPLYYERRFEYTVGNPRSDDYGERQTEYALERAFIWLLEKYSHAILCCSDFVAVHSTIAFGVRELGLEWALPNLTEDMMDRLAASADPRTVTFASFDLQRTTGLDVKTVTLSDPALAKRSGFQTLRHDPSRHRTAGYFADHPDLVVGGLGISRRYGKTWTPAHLSRSSLVALSTGLIERTEDELAHEYTRNPRGYVDYFRNVPVLVKGRPLLGMKRETYSDLLKAILEADSCDGKETSLEPDILAALVQNQGPLALDVSYTFECPACGEVLAMCPNCHLPYVAKYYDGLFTSVCRSCGDRLETDTGFRCECEHLVPILVFKNHLRMHPMPELLQSLLDFAERLDMHWDGTFVVTGNVLRVLPRPEPPVLERINLDNLSLWRTNARYHLRSVPRVSRKSLIRILNKAREKCDKNKFHPSRTDCAQCLASKPSPDDVRSAAICLPRLLGLPIARGFDGIHHGHEQADVIYTDTITSGSTPSTLRLGIHLKSRTRSRPQGLGRSVYRIKALYTQLLYSAYEALIGAASFDVIGISVPNTIKVDVVDSMQRLVNDLGFSFLVIDEDDWLKILDAVLEQLEFET